MLTDKAIRALKPLDKPYKASDGLGLYLLIQPTGSRLWRFKYRHRGKEGVESLGAYPDVSLALARQKRDELRRLRATGVDLAAHRRAIKAAQTEASTNSFRVIGDEWYEKQSLAWAPKHAVKIIERLRRDVYPWLGSRPIMEISPTEILAVLRRIESRGAIETAYRALGDISAIARYAIATQRALSDPCRDLRGALSPRKMEKHFSAITDPKKIPDLLNRIDGYHGTLVVRCALRLAPLVFVRPGELRTAKWADIDLDAAEWRFTASKTKQPHLVPLSTQAVAILRELHPLTGRREYVFPGERSPLRPMSENTVNVALRSLDVRKEEMSGHGFRAMARTVLDEVLKFPAHLVEAQLAHAVRDANGRAYNRTTHIAERRVMMQQWANYLDALREPKVVPIDGRILQGSV
jgi:integrase